MAKETRCRTDGYTGTSRTSCVDDPGDPRSQWRMEQIVKLGHELSLTHQKPFETDRGSTPGRFRIAMFVGSNLVVAAMLPAPMNG